MVLDVLYNSGLHYECLCDFRIVPFLLKEKLPEKLLCSVIYIRADLDFHQIRRRRPRPLRAGRNAPSLLSSLHTCNFGESVL